MATLTATILTALVGLIGVVFGTLIGHYFNQQLSLRNSRKDTLFRKKLEYFEKLADIIENNIKLYKNSINAIKTNELKKEKEEIISKMKERRKNFTITASPLYLNAQNLSKKIIPFVNIEKEIFGKFEDFEKHKPTNKDFAEIEEKIQVLKDNANKIINEMRAEMKR